MSYSRRIEALRALAERPGTEAEGRVAREMLKRAEAKHAQRDPMEAFRDYLHTGSMDDLGDAIGRSVCDCGTSRPAFTNCQNTAEHERIAAEIRQRFPRGTRVFYNQWAYGANYPGRVTGYSREWNWARVKFDNLKNIRSVPIYSANGWHLSAEPLDTETRRPLRGGMERLERSCR
jgi:hypothetical protein